MFPMSSATTARAVNAPLLVYVTVMSTLIKQANAVYGELKVYIEHAYDTPNHDTWFVDSSDPCIELWYGNYHCDSTYTKWDDHTPEWYEWMDCGCVAHDGPYTLKIWDNDDHPTSYCRDAQYRELLGSVTQGPEVTRSDGTYDLPISNSLIWTNPNNGMKLSFRVQWTHSKCMPPSPPSPPPPPSRRPSPPPSTARNNAGLLTSSPSGINADSVIAVAVGGGAFLLLVTGIVVYICCKKPAPSRAKTDIATPTANVQTVTGSPAVDPVPVYVEMPSHTVQVPTEQKYTFHKASAEMVCGIAMKDVQGINAPVVIASLNAGGAAASCGLAVGDALISVNGIRVTSKEQGATLLKSVEGEVKVCVTRLVAVTVH